MEKKTCAGIKPSVSAAPTTDAWAKDKFEAGVEKTNVTIDAVFLVFYYNVKGYDNKAADKNPVRDVKRIGLMYIKSADFKMKEGTEKTLPQVLLPLICTGRNKITITQKFNN